MDCFYTLCFLNSGIGRKTKIYFSFMLVRLCSCDVVSLEVIFLSGCLPTPTIGQRRGGGSKYPKTLFLHFFIKICYADKGCQKFKFLNLLAISGIWNTFISSVFGRFDTPLYGRVVIHFKPSLQNTCFGIFPELGNNVFPSKTFLLCQNDRNKFCLNINLDEEVCIISVPNIDQIRWLNVH